MRDNQTIIVSQKNEGCLSGCGTLFALLLVVGLAIQYWYVVVPLAVVGAGAGVWMWNRRQLEPTVGTAATGPAPSPPTALGAGACPNCGMPSVGNFCPHCGAARGRTCADCGRRGLDSPFCPDCGSATYAPPPPN
jgi:rRNA maturation protein Nop10